MIVSEALSSLRRTPLTRALDKAGARWQPLGDTAIATGLEGATAVVPTVAIADLTPLPRIGFKGRGTMEAMQKRGVTVEATPNRAFVQADGGLCLVLAPGEVILLSNLAGDGAAFGKMMSEWRLEDEERTYPLLRQDSHAWLVMTGARSADVFAKICAVDLRPHKFANLSIAQTSVAKMSAIVTRADLGNQLSYYILADSAAAAYFLDCLLDAAHEFGGALTGWDKIKAIS